MNRLQLLKTIMNTQDDIGATANRGDDTAARVQVARKIQEAIFQELDLPADIPPDELLWHPVGKFVWPITARVWLTTVDTTIVAYHDGFLAHKIYKVDDLRQVVLETNKEVSVTFSEFIKKREETLELSPPDSPGIHVLGAWERGTQVIMLFSKHKPPYGLCLEAFGKKRFKINVDPVVLKEAVIGRRIVSINTGLVVVPSRDIEFVFRKNGMIVTIQEEKVGVLTDILSSFVEYNHEAMTYTSIASKFAPELL